MACNSITSVLISGELEEGNEQRTGLEVTLHSRRDCLTVLADIQRQAG